MRLKTGGLKSCENKVGKQYLFKEMLIYYDILPNSDRKLNLWNRFLIKFGVDYISINQNPVCIKTTEGKHVLSLATDRRGKKEKEDEEEKKRRKKRNKQKKKKMKILQTQIYKCLSIVILICEIMFVVLMLILNLI